MRKVSPAGVNPPVRLAINTASISGRHTRPPGGDTPAWVKGGMLFARQYHYRHHWRKNTSHL